MYQEAEEDDSSHSSRGFQITSVSDPDTLLLPLYGLHFSFSPVGMAPRRSAPVDQGNGEWLLGADGKLSPSYKPALVLGWDAAVGRAVPSDVELGEFSTSMSVRGGSVTDGECHDPDRTAVAMV